ncbi:MAG TPA: hypothetical protein VEY30_02115, partial [Myxococcaceae bacterium]|nr:hypothetical protein [Myxococcaceae bacterium]
LHRQETAGDGLRLGELLVQSGKLTPAALAQALSQQFELPFIQLPDVPAQVSATIPLDYQVERRMVPFRVDPATHFLHVAIDDPFRVDAVEELRFELGRPVKPFLAASDDLDNVLAALRGERLEVIEPLDIEMESGRPDDEEETVLSVSDLLHHTVPGYKRRAPPGVPEAPAEATEPQLPVPPPRAAPAQVPAPGAAAEPASTQTQRLYPARAVTAPPAAMPDLPRTTTLNQFPALVPVNPPAVAASAPRRAPAPTAEPIPARVPVQAVAPPSSTASTADADSIPERVTAPDPVPSEESASPPDLFPLPEAKAEVLEIGGDALTATALFGVRKATAAEQEPSTDQPLSEPQYPPRSEITPALEAATAVTFSEEDLKVLDSLEQMAAGGEPLSDSYKVKPAQMVATLIRLLIRKGAISESEFIEELSRK